MITEAECLLTFCRVADRQGLIIPHASLLRKELLGHIGEFARGNLSAIQAWPPVEAVPALALAQHHGLPTCLLDFTWNPFIAAYFAASEWLESHEQSDALLCVWIINDGQLTLTFNNPKRHNLQLLVPPASDNRTLQAQEGLFVYAPVSPVSIGDLTGDYSPEPAFENRLLKSGIEDVIAKLTLHCKHASLLLHKLIKLGYEGARLFPTYGGSVRSVVEYDWSRIGPAYR